MLADVVAVGTELPIVQRRRSEYRLAPADPLAKSIVNDADDIGVPEQRLGERIGTDHATRMKRPGVSRPPSTAAEARQPMIVSQMRVDDVEPVVIHEPGNRTRRAGE